MSKHNAEVLSFIAKLDQLKQDNQAKIAELVVAIGADTRKIVDVVTYCVLSIKDYGDTPEFRQWVLTDIENSALDTQVAVVLHVWGIERGEQELRAALALAYHVVDIEAKGFSIIETSRGIRCTEVHSNEPFVLKFVDGTLILAVAIESDYFGIKSKYRVVLSGTIPSCQLVAFDPIPLPNGPYLMHPDAFSKQFSTDADWVVAMKQAQKMPIVFPSGYAVAYSGFPAVVREHYGNGMYNVALPGGVACVAGDELDWMSALN